MLAAMKAWLLAAALTLGLAPLSAQAQVSGERARIVVELYTSQGCVQCPRANRLLGRFAREDGVLALTFPVGIWDYLGWRDTFARPEFADRQTSYSDRLRVRGRFTPQLIFNGAAQVSASDWDEARAIFEDHAGAGFGAAAPEVDIARVRGSRVRITLGARADFGREADVWMIAYEPGPLTVIVTSGANINRSISHYNLVRRIERLGVYSGAAVWHERSCVPDCAVVVQERGGGPILSAAFVD
jgi:hypothetical protein